MKKLNATEIKTALVTVPDWKKKGTAIARTFQFKDFPAAIKFVTALAKLAEKAWHHPDIDIRWDTVTLRLSTHSAGGITEADLELAGAIDRIELPG